MPRGWLDAFRVMLPRLRARDDLRRVGVMHLANGVGPAANRQAMLDALLLDAQIEAALAETAKATPVDLAAFGIQVIEE